MNLCMLIGRMGKDAELRYTAGGSPVMNLSLATSQLRGSQESGKVVTDWHRVVAFGKYVETLAPKIKKGAEVFVMGAVTTREWEDKTTGAKKSVTEVTAKTVRLTQEKTRHSEQTDAEIQASYKPDATDEGDWNV